MGWSCENELNSKLEMKMEILEAIEANDIEAARKAIKLINPDRYNILDIINERDWDGRTLLDYAVLNECTEIAELLKQHGGVK